MRLADEKLPSLRGCEPIASNGNQDVAELVPTARQLARLLVMAKKSDIVVHPNADVLAAAAAARLITALADAQSARGSASVVLAGGSIAIAALEQVRLSPARDAVAWSALDVYWGDERWVPDGHEDRNDRQAREALLDHVPVDEARVHPMPASDGGVDLEAAALLYGDQLPAEFDVVLLGMGPDGHTASLFPGHDAVLRSDPTLAVTGSPKPPPTRLSLSLDCLGRGAEVWILAASDAKADAVARAHAADADVRNVPVAGASGRVATRWLLDAAAASRL